MYIGDKRIPNDWCLTSAADNVSWPGRSQNYAKETQGHEGERSDSLLVIKKFRDLRSFIRKNDVFSVK